MGQNLQETDEAQPTIRFCAQNPTCSERSRFHLRIEQIVIYYWFMFQNRKKNATFRYTSYIFALTRKASFFLFELVGGHLLVLMAYKRAVTDQISQ